MRATEAEEGLLKLVHPGRYVEIHYEPIIASEVLKRNPRHSVTRPDVFEYPWIVVRPESVLKLGRVFYIVPNLTIYKLIKEKGYTVQPSLQQKKSPKSYVQRQLLEQSSPSKSSAGTTPKHEDYCQSNWQQFQTTGLEESRLQEQACGERINGPSKLESLADMITKHQSTYKEFIQMSDTDSPSKTESTGEKECHAHEVCSNKKEASEQDQALGDQCEKHITILRTCLRKHDSSRKLLHLKVSFYLSPDNEERKRKVAESEGFITC
ncbi:hypothetical protein Gorai_018809 [Gossypium raimondii]|uniref:Phototropic-responsive NPH3 family protein n=1 Tax=Gossypium raimondii TaxID=29730 RepID=A0A0D2SKK3_GOSRA|nr:hypothetical protein B456_007G154400 [Gossypium raimondii]MBA0590090.1 hypothetical protein [Gossypium raimondii]